MRFNLSKEKVDNLKEYTVKLLKHELLFDEFYALQGVSFAVKRGEPFAIIGENGCGKSTVLKVISGIFRPTVGSVSVGGSVAPLIELGAGFDMDLTARENIFLNGAVLGYDTAFMTAKFDEIMDFAELWEFVDVPVKNFSSGMVARLGFSIATMVVPEILIVDEILAVGDFMFQQKCERKMQEMIASGATLIFVSHSSDQVKKLCKRAVWLKHGVVQMLGDAAEVTDAYIHDMETGGHGLVQAPPKAQVAEVSQVAQVAPQRAAPLAFLNLLRALAVLMIVWDHLGGFRNPDWKAAQAVDFLLTRPLGIIQSFGAFGVALFFLISGFLLAHGEGRGGRGRFAAGRVLKIYPPLVASFAAFFAAQWALSGLPNGGYWAQFSPRDWLLGATLANYPLGIPDVINGTTWYLVPTLLFYALAFVLYPWLRSRPRLTASLMLGAIAAGLFALKMDVLPAPLAALARLSWYVCIPIFGLLMQYLWSGRVRAAAFLLLCGVNYGIMVAGVRLCNPQYYADSPYLISVAYAGLLFAVALLLGERLKSCRAVDYLSKISYSVYLTHMTFGGLLISVFSPHMPYTAAFALTLALVVPIAAALFYGVERPIAHLIRNRR